MNTDKHRLIPRLRFPEFREAGEWEVKRLGDIVDITGGGTPSKSNSNYWNGSFPWISSSDISDESIHDINITRFITEEAINESATKVVPKNSILLVSRVGVGKLAISNKPICTSQDFTNLTPVNDNLVFLAYYLKSIKNVFLSFNQGMAIKGFTKDDIEKIEIYLPNYCSAEQQKIADCLASLDALITAHSRKFDALKTHKKGLMQQLFPRQGETVPRLRFPEFRDAGEWEEKCLGDIANFSKGKGISKSDISENGTQPCIRYGELYTRYGETIDSVESYTELPASCLVLSRANDVIIPASGETQEDIATASCVLKDGIALGGDLNIIRTELNGVFLSYYLNNAKKSAIAQVAQGISVVHLYAGQLKKLSVNLPCRMEQQKIADCLSTLDALITVQGKKIDALKAHKKG